MIVIPNDKLLELCSRSSKIYTAEEQLRMLQEECGECIVAVNHTFRERESAINNLYEEVADVLLMAIQARMLLGEENIDNMLQKKMDRLENRLIENGN